jgi:hypothetical protein
LQNKYQHQFFEQVLRFSLIFLTQWINNRILMMF